MRNFLWNKKTNPKAIAEHTRRIFSISQPFPSSILKLLTLKKQRELTEREQRDLYDQIKEKNIFPVLSNPKTLIEFCGELSVEFYKQGETIDPDTDCYLVLDGGIKIYEHLSISENEEEMNCVKEKDSGIMVEKKKINIGEVLYFEETDEVTEHATTLPTVLLKIPNFIHSGIALSNLMTEVKKKQEFFTKTPLFEKHYRSSLEDFVNSLEEITCGFDKKIFDEGQDIEYVYIVKEGEFLLEKNFKYDGLTIKNRKITLTEPNETEEVEFNINSNNKNFRMLPHKIIGPKEILGACEYLLNSKKYLHSMRCRKEGSVLYVIKVEDFFNKLYVAENGEERAKEILYQIYEQRILQIDEGLKFNQSNQLMLRILPNASCRFKTFYSSKDRRSNSNHLSWDNKHQNITTHRSSNEFFERMNKTIINFKSHSIKQRSHSKSIETKKTEKHQRKTYKTPAIVQEVVEIVNQKKAYHRLRNSGVEGKGAFEFDINNVPAFIKKKYGRLLPPTIKKE